LLQYFLVKLENNAEFCELKIYYANGLGAFSVVDDAGLFKAGPAFVCSSFSRERYGDQSKHRGWDPRSASEVVYRRF
jgi:hypothetical protein